MPTRRDTIAANSRRDHRTGLASWRRPSSLRARLIAIVILADCLAALSIGAVVVLKARIATKVEIASAMQLTQSLVADTIRLMQDAPAPILLQSLDLHFQSVRHVRIAVSDADGRPVEAKTSTDALLIGPAASAPKWFSRLVAPPIETKEFPIIVRRQPIGRVAIMSEPSDEIDEAWTYAHALLVTSAVLNVIVLVALFLVFGRVLAPLEALVEGLRGFESRNYTMRLPRSSIKELAAITDHFNRTAATLSSAEEDNRRLNRELLTAQDDERRRTALELHDEVGPCLFALEASATSILAMTKGRIETDLPRLRERAADVVSLVERVQVVNRRVLDHLRPMALGQIPMRDSLGQLFVDFESAGHGLELDNDIGPLRESYGFLIDLTIYRCVQEGLLNAARHAKARNVRLRVGEIVAAGATNVVVEVADDGVGMRNPSKLGRGLTGMRERVEALAGTFDLESSPNGVHLAIALPIAADGSSSTPQSRAGRR